MNSELDFEQSEIEINVDVVNQNNYQERPQTSYGRIKDRKKKMKQSSKQVCIMKALCLNLYSKVIIFIYVNNNNYIKK